MKALRPTIMPAVPRLLNRVYDKVSDTDPEIRSRWRFSNPRERILKSHESKALSSSLIRLFFETGSHV